MSTTRLRPIAVAPSRRGLPPIRKMPPASPSGGHTPPRSARPPARSPPPPTPPPSPPPSPAPLRPGQARAWRTLLARSCCRGGDRGFSRRRRRRLDGAWGIGGGANPLRHVHRASARCPQGLRGRGASSGRGYRRRAAAFGAMVVETSRLRTADPGVGAGRLEAGGGTVPAGSVWPRGILHV